MSDEKPHDLREVEPCSFVLSTGRCGTKTLAILFQRSPGAFVFHEPRPTLFEFARQAYTKRYDIGRLLRVLQNCRGTFLQQSAAYGFGYIETGNHCTFYAEALAHWLPKSKFIHLVREPRAVIRSGAVRGWFRSMTKYDRTRIHPIPGTEAAQLWEMWEQWEKIAWLWAATNRHIIDFSAAHPGRCLLVPSEKLFKQDADTIEGMYTHIGVMKPTVDEVHAVLRQRINRQSGLTRFRAPDEWNDEENAKLEAIAGVEMGELGYT